MRNSFFLQEQACTSHYELLGEVYHVSTPENAPVYFVSSEDFDVAMSLMALTFLICPKVKLIAFEIMSNHFHFVIQGNTRDILDVLNLYKGLLVRSDDKFTNHASMKNMSFNFFKLNSINYMRNTIAYVHRNACMVNPDTTPFTYKWGTNLNYFNTIHNGLVRSVWKPSFQYWRREISHRKIFDDVTNANILDSAVSPLCFCNVEAGEKVFRNARHYFETMCKNVEEYTEISRLCGEKVALLDDEIYKVTRTVAKNDFGAEDIMHLDSASRIAIAKKLKWNYSASNKQIHRVLRLELPFLESMFGKGF